MLHCENYNYPLIWLVATLYLWRYSSYLMILEGRGLRLGAAAPSWTPHLLATLVCWDCSLLNCAPKIKFYIITKPSFNTDGRKPIYTPKVVNIHASLKNLLKIQYISNSRVSLCGFTKWNNWVFKILHKFQTASPFSRLQTNNHSKYTQY